MTVSSYTGQSFKMPVLSSFCYTVQIKYASHISDLKFSSNCIQKGEKERNKINLIYFNLKYDLLKIQCENINETLYVLLYSHCLQNLPMAYIELDQPYFKWSTATHQISPVLDHAVPDQSRRS